MFEADAVTILPFVKDLERAGARRSFWAPSCDGLGYLEAVELGEELALEAVRYMRVESFKGLLAWAVFDMPRRPNDAQKGAMVGFLYVFAELALTAASPKGLAAYELHRARQRERLRQILDAMADDEDEEPAE